MYKIEIVASAEKEMDKLGPETHQRISQKILKLEQDPRPPKTSRRLAGDFEGYRLRVGDWRVLYTINAKTKTVLIYSIKHRREAYRR